MDFEKFIEDDMLKYLDKRMTEIADQTSLLREEEFSMFEITSDYSKEINDALKSGNVVQAKQILEEVKTKYVQAPQDTISKKRLYTIMEEIYERIKDSEEGNKESLLDTIKGYEEEGLFSRPEFFKKKVEDSIGLIISAISQTEKAIEEETAKENPTIFDAEKAAKSYKELKELIKRIPDDHEDLKGRASERALSLYYAIKKIKDSLQYTGKESAASNPDDDVKNLENRLADIRILKVKIIDAHNNINKSLAKRDISGCIKEYRKLKKLCQNFPKELSQERIALLAEALSVFERIKMLKEEMNLANEKAEAPSIKNSPVEPKPAENKITNHVQRIRDDIAISQRTIDEYLYQKDIRGSMKEYTHLKMLCKIFPKDPDPQEKVSILASALATFEKIRKAKDAIDKERKAEEERHNSEADEDAAFEEFKRELDDRISHVKEFLSQKDSQSAIAAYSEMKQLFNSYPDEPLKRKKALYDEILNSHLDMALLDKDFKNKSIVQSDAKAKEIRDGLLTTKELLAKNRTDEATHSLLEIKHKTLLLPNEEFDQKYNFLNEIDELEQRLLVSKNIQRMDTMRGVTQ
jgi:hypothetical protein